MVLDTQGCPVTVVTVELDGAWLAPVPVEIGPVRLPRGGGVLLDAYPWPDFIPSGRFPADGAALRLAAACAARVLVACPPSVSPGRALLALEVGRLLVDLRAAAGVGGGARGDGGGPATLRLGVGRPDRAAPRHRPHPRRRSTSRRLGAHRDPPPVSVTGEPSAAGPLASRGDGLTTSGTIVSEEVGTHPLIESRRAEIQGLCRRLAIRRLDLFGSATSEAFDLASSDVDVLVEFDADSAAFDYYDTYFELKEGLERLLDRAACPFALIALVATSPSGQPTASPVRDSR